MADLKTYRTTLITYMRSILAISSIVIFLTSLLIKNVVGEGLGLYYELDLLEVLELACGSLEIE